VVCSEEFTLVADHVDRFESQLRKGAKMRCHWESIGVLGPVYRLVGRGLSDRDIATNLGVTELTVQGCVAWLLRFLGFTERSELAVDAFNS
jgi:hypothetical protein